LTTSTQQFVFTHPVEVTHTSGDRGIVLRPIDGDTLSVYDYVRGQIVSWERASIVAESPAQPVTPVVVQGKVHLKGVVGAVLLANLLTIPVLFIVLLVLGTISGLIK